MFIQDHNKTAIFAGDRAISYTELLCESRHYGDLVKVKKNDRVIILCENRPEWIFAFFAAWVNHAISVPVDITASADDIAYIIKDCAPAAAVISSQTAELFKKAQKIAKKEVAAYSVDSVKKNKKKYPSDPISPSDMDDTAAIIYTSGTTGDPKGVMLTYQNFMSNIEAVSGEKLHYKKSSVVMILLPLHHVFPLAGSMLAPLYIGSSCAIATSLTAADIMETLQKNKVTLFIGVPRLYSLLRTGIMAKIKKSFVGNLFYHLLSVVRIPALAKIIFKQVHKTFGGAMVEMISGGAPLDKKDADFFTIIGFKIVEGYGMTEAAPMITCPQPNKYRMGTVGRPIPGTEVKIIDGEICFRGPNMMKGYYKRPKETADIIRDGWLHTGDLGYFDKGGYLVITGRSKEIIVLSNGKNINPSEIEDKILKLSPMILEAGVFDEKGMLSLVIRPDMKKLDEAEIHNFDEFFRNAMLDKYNRSVAPYKRIARYYLVEDELPRTRLGKLRRFLLKECISPERTSRKREKDPDLQEYHALKAFLVGETGKDIYPDDHLEVDLGMDSLAKVSLLAYIKSTFGIHMEDKLLSKYGKINKLAEFISKNRPKMKIEIKEVNWGTIIRNMNTNFNLARSRFPHITAMSILKVVLNSVLRIRVEGRENLPEGACILAPNHQSFLDWPVVATALSRGILRKTYIFAKEKHFNTKLHKWFAARFNVIVMDINRDLNESIQMMADVLKKGNYLAIFPEGTRNTEGEPGLFKKSFAILSKELQVPVVPVVISGTERALPVQAFFIRPFRKISVSFLSPVYPKREKYEEFAEKIRQKIAAAIEDKKRPA